MKYIITLVFLLCIGMAPRVFATTSEKPLPITPISITQIQDNPTSIAVVGTTPTGDKRFLIPNAIPPNSAPSDVDQVLEELMGSIQQGNASLVWAGSIFILSTNQGQKSAVKLKNFIYTQIEQRMPGYGNTPMNSIESTPFNTIEENPY